MDTTPSFSDLLQQLQNNDPAAIEQLYRLAYPYTAGFILSNDGTPHDARRCFRRALTIFFQQVMDSNLQLNCRTETYLYALSRIIWLRELSRRSKVPINLDTDSPEATLPNISDAVLSLAALPDAPSAEMMQALEAMKPDHKQFLLSYYFYKIPLQQLADQMDYSESFAKVKKRRCLDELRRLLKGEKLEPEE